MVLIPKILSIFAQNDSTLSRCTYILQSDKVKSLPVVIDDIRQLMAVERSDLSSWQLFDLNGAQINKAQDLYHSAGSSFIFAKSVPKLPSIDKAETPRAIAGSNPKSAKSPAKHETKPVKLPILRQKRSPNNSARVKKRPKKGATNWIYGKSYLEVKPVKPKRINKTVPRKKSAQLQTEVETIVQNLEPFSLGPVNPEFPSTSGNLRNDSKESKRSPERKKVSFLDDTVNSRAKSGGTGIYEDNQKEVYTKEKKSLQRKPSPDKSGVKTTEDSPPINEEMTSSPTKDNSPKRSTSTPEEEPFYLKLGQHRPTGRPKADVSAFFGHPNEFKRRSAPKTRNPSAITQWFQPTAEFTKDKTLSLTKRPSGNMQISQKLEMRKKPSKPKLETTPKLVENGLIEPKTETKPEMISERKPMTPLRSETRTLSRSEVQFPKSVRFIETPKSTKSSAQSRLPMQPEETVELNQSVLAKPEKNVEPTRSKEESELPREPAKNAEPKPPPGSTTTTNPSIVLTPYTINHANNAQTKGEKVDQHKNSKNRLLYKPSKPPDKTEPNATPESVQMNGSLPRPVEPTHPQPPPPAPQKGMYSAAMENADAGE